MNGETGVDIATLLCIKQVTNKNLLYSTGNSMLCGHLNEKEIQTRASLVAQTKESACSAGDLGSILGLGRSPGGRHGNPLQYSCLENPHGQKSLAGYSPWGHKESDTTEQLNTHVHTYTYDTNFQVCSEK